LEDFKYFLRTAERPTTQIDLSTIGRTARNCPVIVFAITDIFHDIIITASEKIWRLAFAGIATNNGQLSKHSTSQRPQASLSPSPSMQVAF
jgi:hypothetical protein